MQLDWERKRNLVGLMRTARRVDKDGEVVDWQEGLDNEKVYRMGKRFKKCLDSSVFVSSFFFRASENF